MTVRTLAPEWTLLGGDPEIAFVKDGVGITPASAILTNDKETQTNRGAVEVDGFFAELHPKPDTCRERLTTRYKNCLRLLYNSAIQHGNELSGNSVVNIPDELLAAANEEEVDLGCAPDIDAYSGAINTIDVVPRKLNLRTGGGHIHFGFNVRNVNKVMAFKNGKWLLLDTYEEVAPDIIKTMDYLCGIPSILLDTGDGPRQRRELYGKAGAYRIQPHGIEYRVLSNFWLWHSTLVSVVYLLGRISLIIATEYPTYMEKLFKLVPEEDIQSVINENDDKQAAEITKRFVPIVQTITNYPVLEFIFFVNRYGKEKLFKGDYRMNWGIGLQETWDTINHREWWGQGTMGLESFLSVAPSSIKSKFNQITAKELN